MKAGLIAHAVLDECNLEDLDSRPEFRKATRTMRSATGVAELALSRLPESLRAELREAEFQNMVLVYGSSLGELDATRDFLYTLRNQKMARPILFQNSLHNATLGHLTLCLRFTGPALTVSQRFFTAETAIQTAMNLLNEEQTYAMVVCSETVLPDFMVGYDLTYPKDVRLREGAAAAIFSLKHPGPTIRKISFPLTSSEPSPSTFYDSMGLEQIIAHIKKPDFAEKTLLPKPFDSACEIEFDV